MSKRLRKRKKMAISNLPKNTSISIMCAIVNVIFIITLIIRATITDGNVGIISGLIGVLSIAIGGFGIYYAILGIKKDDNIVFTFPLIAIGSNVLITIFLTVLYVIGIF